MSTWDDLIESAWRDIRDADRCVALSITPAAYQLHRRLRQVTQAMEALLTDEAVERVAAVLADMNGEPRAGRFEQTMARAALTAAIEGEQ